MTEYFPTYYLYCTPGVNTEIKQMMWKLNVTPMLWKTRELVLIFLTRPVSPSYHHLGHSHIRVSTNHGSDTRREVIQWATTNRLCQKPYPTIHF